jgi:ABC-type lipoprotein export system ATPase subunit
LSGGEQQRVAVARALANEPAVLLADEPTGNLDRRNSDLVADLFRELASNGQAIVMVTHDLTLASRAARIITMEDGRITADRLADDVALPHATATIPHYDGPGRGNVPDDRDLRSDSHSCPSHSA